MDEAAPLSHLRGWGDGVGIKQNDKQINKQKLFMLFGNLSTDCALVVCMKAGNSQSPTALTLFVLLGRV